VITRDQIELFREVVERSASVVLTSHVQPDGDAVGSLVALSRYLGFRGKAVRAINQDPVPETLQFVADPHHPLEAYEPARHDGLIERADAVLLVDNAAPDRLGTMEPAMRRAAQRTLCIDHHPSRETPWRRMILDEGSCATTVIIYELLRESGHTPDRLAAEAIYVGLATDTGFFRFNSTSARAHEIAAELLRLGVDPARTYQRIYERNSLAYTRLLGHALSGVQVFSDGALALVTLPAELIRRIDAAGVDTSEITTALLAMEGVGIAVLFRELPEGRVKVSLRSKGRLDVHRLAGEFGGGGHRNASGIVMLATLDDAVSRVTARARALVEGGP
jgi:phosphoesterase RecJ-like protein